jgi:hypothetical protein
METVFYSKTAGGFYTREIHGDNTPAMLLRLPRPSMLR